MKALQLRERPGLGDDKKLQGRMKKLERLLACLQGKELPEDIHAEIATLLQDLNAVSDQDPGLKQGLRQTYDWYLANQSNSETKALSPA